MSPPAQAVAVALLALRSHTSAMLQVRPVPPVPLRWPQLSESEPPAVAARGTGKDTLAIGEGGRK